MVDIHAHILPGVDDGADTMSEAIRMLKLASEGGTKELVVTPHCNIPYVYDNYSGERINRIFKELKEEAALHNINIELYLGAEVFLTHDIVKLLKKGMLNTINGGKYMLVEFDFGEDPEYMDEVLEMLISEGIIPVVAHPERYYAVADYPEMIYYWIELGCGIQINKGSVTGRFGHIPRAVARLLLEHNLVHCASSDAHSSTMRTPYLYDAYEEVRDMYGKEYAKLIFDENPHNIIKGKKLKLNGTPILPDVNVRGFL